jgi:predicted MFS family arabinose efflux permease
VKGHVVPVLSTRLSFWTAAAVAAIALWASGAPAMVYPVYVAEWHLAPIVVTSIFAVYPISLVVVLIVFGSISDYVGRRATLIAGLTAMAVGILLFALAPNVGWLFAGRVFQGIGVGLAMAPASAAMVEFNRGGNSGRASSINTAATALGLALATIVGGALVQYAPLPSRTTYWVLLTLTAAVFAAVLFMPRRVVGAEVTDTGAAAPWRPRGIVVPAGLVTVFLTASIAIAAGFAMGALFLSLGSSIAKNLIGTDNAFVAGSVIAISAVTIGISAVLGRRLRPRTAIGSGGLATAAGMGLLVFSATTASLGVFVAASVVAGAGYGLLFLGGLGLVNAHAPAHHRAQTLSAAYLVAYLTQGLIAVAIGLSATAEGLASAVDLWAPVIAALCLLASAFALVTALRARTPSRGSGSTAGRTPA